MITEITETVVEGPTEEIVTKTIEQKEQVTEKTETDEEQTEQTQQTTVQKQKPEQPETQQEEQQTTTTLPRKCPEWQLSHRVPCCKHYILTDTACSWHICTLHLCFNFTINNNYSMLITFFISTTILSFT